MTFGRDLPTSFQEGIGVARQILSANHDLVRKGLLATETEQIVLAAFRMAAGQALSRMDLYSRAGDRLPEAVAERILVLAGARAEGRLLQHLTGSQVFLDHEYEVSAAVLIPRPETEVLVDAAIRTLRGANRAPRRGLEIGLGSGCISIELLARFPGLRMTASELRPEAEAVARRNAGRILNRDAADAGRLEILRAARPTDVWEPFEAVGYPPSIADFLISNPPYLAADSEVDTDVLAHEPRSALFAPAGDPLHFYRRIAEEAPARLGQGSYAFLEVAHERAAETRALFSLTKWRSADVLLDLNGRQRVLVAITS